jgi:predicted outer membrane protein
MNEFVLPGLVKRRAALAGEMEAAQARVQKLRADLAALDAVIRQFDPAYPVDMIAAKQPRRLASSRPPAPTWGAPYSASCATRTGR